MNHLRKFLVALCFIAFAQRVVVPTLAQTPSNYPNKPVRMIMGNAAGGPIDIAGRIFASGISEIWGQQLVVDNRPGAGNTIGATIASKAAPDGYTLFMCVISEAIAPALHKNLPFDLLASFIPISLIGTTTNVMIIHPSIPAHSVPEFVAYTKANPGQVSYGSTGVGTSTHLSTELFKSMTGANITHVPYKTGQMQLADLLTGRIAMIFPNLPAYLNTIKSGKVRALAVSTAKRSAQLPDVPTIAESGVPGFEVSVWYGLSAPAGTPKPIVDKIGADTLQVLHMPGIRQRLEQQGIEATPTSPAEFAAFLKSEITKWAKAVKDAGIQPN